MDARNWIGFLLLYGLGCLGHLVLWTTLFNQKHATAIEHHRKKVYEKLVYLAVAVLGILGSWRLLLVTNDRGELESLVGGESVMPSVLAAGLWGYLILCDIAAVLIIIRWLVWKRLLRRPEVFRVESLKTIDLLGETQVAGGEASQGKSRSVAINDYCGTPTTRRMAGMRGNQLLSFEVNEKTVGFTGLASDLQGLTIAHASDFHLTGQMTARFYERIADELMGLQCDLIALTGDVIDKPHCLEWLPGIFGKLQAPLGVWYVLGNHDCRIEDEARLRSILSGAGLRTFAGGWETVEVGGSRLHLAGNELPWYRGCEPEGAIDPLSRSDGDVALLLSHSPDQIAWAVEHGVDLILAGHTHGGQIRVPGIGPIISPSRYGVKYASGEFLVGQTRMHVSRGVCGTHPIRLNCRPEVTRLRLVEWSLPG